MKTRRKFLMILTTGFVALGLIAGSAIADELFGVITKVDVEGKKLTVVEKDTDKEIEITTNADTKIVTKNGEIALDLEKLSKNVAKAKDANKKYSVKIDHEKSVASKITPAKKKTAN
jgi:predicted RNA-binding protein Jag